MRRREFLTGVAALAAYSRVKEAEALTQGQILTLLGSVNAASFAPYPAPPGYHWEFVTSNGQKVTSNGQPVVALVQG